MSSAFSAGVTQRKALHSEAQPILSPESDILIFGAPAAYLQMRASLLTLWHSSGTDISSHAAAFGICRIVAGYDLYLITGKVLQVGDDRRLL